MRPVNEKTKKLIKSFESCKLSPYPDIVKVPTIGWGTTYYPNGKKVTLKDSPITQEQADFLFDHEVLEKASIIDTHLKKIGLNLNDNQFGALVSFSYNVGVAPAIEPGRSLNAALKAKNLQQIADILLIYNKGTFLGVKRVVKGLARRREEERLLFLTPV